jgi:predicted neuraminidase
MARLRNGSLVLAFNNSSVGVRDKPATSARKPLSIALSRDKGASWPWVRDIETGNLSSLEIDSRGKQKVHEEYSYPSLLEDAQGKINVAYSYNRKTIKVVRFEEEWITQGHTQGQFKGGSLR